MIKFTEGAVRVRRRRRRSRAKGTPSGAAPDHTMRRRWRRRRWRRKRGRRGTGGGTRRTETTETGRMTGGLSRAKSQIFSLTLV